MVIGRRYKPKPGDAARKARTARVIVWAAELRPTIEALQASGVTSLKDIARALNERGIPSAPGRWCGGSWAASLRAPRGPAPS
jgi:hypothetical protein